MAKNLMLILIALFVFTIFPGNLTAACPVSWDLLVTNSLASNEDHEDCDEDEIDEDFDYEEEFEEDDYELEEIVCETLELIEEIHPDLHDLLADEEGEFVKDEYFDLVVGLSEIVEEFEYIREEEETADLELKIHISNVYTELLAEEYSFADKQEQQEIRELLEDELDILFDLHIQMREIQIKMINEELEELRRELEVAKKNKKSQIKAHLKKLTTKTIFN
ncbi:hypothetical protein SMSP2_01718 [Limihaloglobus sulfuriphilus]|uniref:Uncharacterized protein n=1 Tax=Limihaloglobus sulfuriphilus TaxID=1851148 RepID=A0A1Q2MF65_9BACT|nr:hypothetical protein [Limihaloglobus sulfuriphilus]AQQ71345.1 hypothetical protein SMSP2_01718 [Limihaloglobus sulfuriphilus]